MLGGENRSEKAGSHWELNPGHHWLEPECHKRSSIPGSVCNMLYTVYDAITLKMNIHEISAAKHSDYKFQPRYDIE